ncbi:MAG: beta-galactosidase [Lachnospiraceae bacterium]|nr:beta-galactosidase [Lachnospiraceae bacterium]
MINKDDIKQILYGGDYNPEQWPQEVREEDMRLLKGVSANVVTLNVFSWAKLQPDENTYDFRDLDRIVEQVSANGMNIVMATSTAAMPAWMAHRYPDILRTDFEGRKHRFGGRHNACPHSPTYRKYSAALAGKLAEHYKDQKNIVAWHISNEYGGRCYCEQCAKAFRVWLKDRYGTLKVLNDIWNTAFWSHTFYDWEEIQLPNALTEHLEEKRSQFPGITLDFYRFTTQSLLDNYRAEVKAIRSFIPDASVTTNFMGHYKELDYKAWAPYLDFISWDNYPAAGEDPADIAMKHDLMRGLKNDRPFALMEQTPSVSNWYTYPTLKRPGEMRKISYQAMAHGADTVMFFQMRQCRGECETFHGAFISHSGSDQTRTYKELASFGQELKGLGEILGTLPDAKVAILFDWENWWAIEATPGMCLELDYVEEVKTWYRALYHLGISTDVIGCEEDLEKYSLVIAPDLYMVKKGVAERLSTYAKNGGTVIFSLYSGLADENNNITQRGYPGELREMTGIWTEEYDCLELKKTDEIPDGLEPEETGLNSFYWEGRDYACKHVFAISHPERAEVLATYEKAFYAGTPVLTCNRTDRGNVYYLGTKCGPDFYRDFLKKIAVSLGIITGDAAVYPEEIEVTDRSNGTYRYTFVLNHGRKSISLPADRRLCGLDMLTGKTITQGDALNLDAYGVAILRSPQ